MLVLLILYPLVFAFDVLFAPSLTARGAPLWLSLFVSNVFCVTLLGFLVPWVCRHFAWWLAPPNAGRHVDVLGAGLLLGLYGALLMVFAWVSPTG